MARGRNNNKMTRRQPAVLQMSFLVETGTSYIDLALCASILNRRSYKQENHTWGVASFELFTGGSGVVSLEKLPETWVYKNAYKKSKSLYDKMNDQVLDTEPGIEGKYADFKIGMNVDHVAQSIQDAGNPTGRILTPITPSGVFTVADFNGAVAPIADWDFSKLEIPNDPVSGTTTGYTMHAVGASTGTSKGLINGYELSRARPNQQEPNVPNTEGWMNELFDDGEQLEEIRDNLNTDNDRAPYPVGQETGGIAYYPGGSNELAELQTHSFCNFTPTTVSAKNTIMGGMFQNGLIAINNSTDQQLSLIIHLMPGSHRGYLCEVM